MSSKLKSLLFIAFCIVCPGGSLVFGYHYYETHKTVSPCISQDNHANIAPCSDVQLKG